jgi:putative oligomerization/nucleic acid binding protein
MDRHGDQPFPPFGSGRLVERVGEGGGPSDLAWVIFSLLLVLLLLAIVSLALDAYFRSQRPRPFTRWLPPGMPPGPFPGGRALAVLGVRYARGEISREEYLQARADLSGEPEDIDEAPTQVVLPEPPAGGRRKEEPEA